MNTNITILWISILSLGCADKVGSDAPLIAPELDGLPVLGDGTQSVSGVVMTKIGDSSDGLQHPRDLAINPGAPGELWVVNGPDDSMTIFTDVATPDQTSDHIIDPFAMHFMDAPSSIAFGAQMYEPNTAYNFATCQESENTYEDYQPPDQFMGPTLWNSDRSIFGESNPEAVAYLTDMMGFHTDLGSHIDMLHESPNCMGIAHDEDNIYWVFDGYNKSIYKYDFQEDHGIGWDDHLDGIMARYVEDEVGYQAGVPSHLVLDQESRLLYIADTANNRIAILDTETGEDGDNLPMMEPGTTHYQVDGAELWTFIDGSEFGLEAPSGIDLVDDILFVTDNSTAEIVAFSPDGAELDRLNTGLGSGALMGIFAASAEDLWIVDAKGDKVFRIQPK